ncbi:hypothetical protein [Rhodovulum sp. PH10]|uniref:hypothetical protein n=1 Tax=Rhodovulum sp. PH10 TaxID=1187851 RepID=UPI0009FC2202|nr:hypothetical protein [Rhodovulum sp. PH10]
MAEQSTRKREAAARRLGAALGTALRDALAGAAVAEPADAVAAFVRARCVREPGGSERAAALLAAYLEWATGTGAPRLSATALARGLHALGLRSHKSSIVLWRGVRLAPMAVHAVDPR